MESSKFSKIKYDFSYKIKIKINQKESLKLKYAFAKFITLIKFLFSHFMFSQIIQEF